MSMQKYPCADCPDCIPIGGGVGLCEYVKKVAKVVNLFDVHPNCPKPEDTKED